MSNKHKAVIKRFFKAFAAGVVSTAGLVTIGSPSTWSDLGTALSAAIIALVAGGINGVLMAAEKSWNWRDSGEIASL